MKKNIRILLVEDSEDDALLIRYQFQLHKYNAHILRVETAADMIKALNGSEWDVVICDYNLPQFSAPEALQTLQESQKDLPFLIVSGTIGEEKAVAVMKAGAHDYIMKDNMVRLVPAVEREIQEAQNRNKRLQAEQALRSSEANYQEIFDAANDSITLHDYDTGEIIEANKRASEYLGYSHEELIGMQLDQLTTGEGSYDSGKTLPKFKNILSSDSEIIEWPIQHKSGSTLWTELNLKLASIRGKEVILVIGRDIGERKKFSEALALSEERYRNVVENASDTITIIVNDNIKFANQRAVELTGYPLEELLKKQWSDLLQRKSSPHDNLPTMEADQPFHTQVYQLFTKDGTDKWVHLNQVNIEFDGQSANLNFIRDITEQRKLEDRLKMAQKMEAIGTLAGGIAHDFNNILSPIMGYTELVMDEFDPDSRAYKNLSQVFSAANRARELVHQILTFSRQSECEPSPLRLQLVVNEALKLLRASIPANVKFDLSIDKNCAPVIADPTQIHQIVMNLCTNAYQAMQDNGGLLKVSLQNVTISSQETKNFSGLNEGKYVLLTVSDTGHGMERTIMQRIFDPFFTTKQKQHGTGMGLSVVHGIVKQHKGFIDLASEVGKGSTFKVFFPAHKADQKIIDSPEEKIIMGNGERILLVDDEKAILNLLKQLLEDMNYKPSVCEESLHAVELFKKDPTAFDLVITDQIMPNLTGDLLAKQLLQIRKDLPIILCTGFSENLGEEKSRAIGIHSIVLKPLLKVDLARSIRNALDQKK